MKEIISYKCDVCSAVYDSREEAESCELKHKRCKDFIEEKFSSSDIYPNRIRVLFRDGKTGYYNYEVPKNE